MSLGPFDLTGGPFLFLYLCLFLATALISAFIASRLRPVGRRQRVTDLDQLAWLAGGRRRFGQAVVARLLAGKALRLEGGNLYAMAAPEAGATPGERSVLSLHAPIRWQDVSRGLLGPGDLLEHGLEKAGLIVSRKQWNDIAFWATLPWLMLFVFGATKWVIGDMRDKPIGFLTAALIGTFIVAVARWLTVDRRTRAGKAAIADARTGRGRIRRAPAGGEVGLAVALFGTAVLAGSPWESFHRMRSAGDGGSSGSGCGGGGDSGGSSGCGGGGCGGCGS